MPEDNKEKFECPTFTRFEDIQGLFDSSFDNIPQFDEDLIEVANAIWTFTQEVCSREVDKEVLEKAMTTREQLTRLDTSSQPDHVYNFTEDMLGVLENAINEIQHKLKK